MDRNLVPAQRSAGSAQPTQSDPPVRLVGDAHVAITAPFYPADDPLAPHDEYVAPAADDLDGEGLLVRGDLPWHSVLTGTLTFQQPTIGELTSFVGAAGWLADLHASLNRVAGGPAFDRIELSGVLFPDGYGSVAVILRLPHGWEPSRRTATLAAVGDPGRDELASQLRSHLLPPLQRLLRNSSAGNDDVAELPYFNLTYAGETDHPQPGRSTLDDELRPLLYPDSSAPLTSRSPWVNEFLYTGYAYHLLAMRDPVPNLQRLGLLLLVLNASYARLARYATAADEALRRGEANVDVLVLPRIERRLRAEYQSLITPTFSFDHHALQVRDAIMAAWDVSRLQARTDNLISMVRGAVEFRLAQDQARRIRRLNYLVMILTAIAVIPVIETAIAAFQFLAQ